MSYATGASWPLSDAGRGNVERPVAVVLVDDEVPHLFTPFRADAASELDLDDDHLHGPTYLDADEGVAAFARALADLVPPTATVAIDDVTGAMHRDRDLPVRGLAPAGGQRGDERGSRGQDARRARLPPPRPVDHGAGHGRGPGAAWLPASDRRI